MPPFLLDTHTFIWFMNGDNTLPLNIQAIISDPSNPCYLSIISIWEIAIKQSLNKLQLHSGFYKIEEFLFENNIVVLHVKFRHLQLLTQLEFYHRDPFDRIIISQAISEDYIILSKDTVFKLYQPLKVIWE